MEDTLIAIAKELRYRRIAKLEQMTPRDKFDLLNHALKNSIRGNYAICFFKASLIQITPFGIVWSAAFSGKKLGKLSDHSP